MNQEEGEVDKSEAQNGQSDPFFSFAIVEVGFVIKAISEGENSPPKEDIEEVAQISFF